MTVREMIIASLESMGWSKTAARARLFVEAIRSGETPHDEDIAAAAEQLADLADRDSNAPPGRRGNRVMTAGEWEKTWLPRVLEVLELEQSGMSRTAAVERLAGESEGRQLREHVDQNEDLGSLILRLLKRFAGKSA